MPKAKTPEEILDRFLDTAPKDRLLRLYSDVHACLRFKHGMFNEEPAVKRAYTKKVKDDAQLPLEPEKVEIGK